MKFVTIFLFAVVFFSEGLCQKPCKVISHEVGFDLASFRLPRSPHYYSYNKPSIQLLNGIFYRAIIKRIGLRAQVNYNKNVNREQMEDMESFSSTPHYLSCTNLELKTGIQYGSKNKKVKTYVFTDLLYRNLIAEVEMRERSGNGSYTFNTETWREGISQGFGCTAKILDRVNISPELFSDFFFQQNFLELVDKNTGEYFAIHDTYKGLQPRFRLILTLDL